MLLEAELCLDEYSEFLIEIFIVSHSTNKVLSRFFPSLWYVVCSCLIILQQLGRMYSKSGFLLGFGVFFFSMQSHAFFFLLWSVMCEGGCWSPPDGPEISYPDLYFLNKTPKSCIYMWYGWAIYVQLFHPPYNHIIHEKPGLNWEMYCPSMCSI